LKTSQVAIDASFLLKLFLPEDSSDQVEQKWGSWIEESVEVIAPTLMVYEVSSVLRNKVHRGILKEEDGLEIIDKLKDLDISLIYTKELMEIAWEIAGVLKAPNLYDSAYLAVAGFFRVPFWTADLKLYQSARRHYPFIMKI
jgi:predicted nucleic acid-binding protein